MTGKRNRLDIFGQKTNSVVLCLDMSHLTLAVYKQKTKEISPGRVIPNVFKNPRCADLRRKACFLRFSRKL